MRRIAGSKAAPWIAALVALGLTGPALGADIEAVCGRVLACRNYIGPVVGTAPDGAQVSAFERRVTVFKLLPGTVMVVTLVVFGDGGRALDTATWDFIDEKQDTLSREGKFTVYSDVPDMIGTNTIGTGRCARGTCTYTIARPKDERTVTGTWRMDGDALTLEESEVTTYQGKRETTRYAGRLILDEK